ncbi:hypothetical protein G3860_003059, partial [Escherichia coli]|nr:hypothetical protein [Escherichia coli]
DVRCEKQPWTETIWRQSLRGAGFRNLALALNTCYIEEVLASCSELGFRTDKMKNLTQI